MAMGKVVLTILHDDRYTIESILDVWPMGNCGWTSPQGPIGKQKND